MEIIVERDDYGIPKICKDCGFFNDCPIDYECPPMAILKEMGKE